MSIKPDSWIKRKSLPPTHILQRPADVAAFLRGNASLLDNFAWAGITNNQEELDNWVRYDVAVEVTPEILEKFEWKPMIEPFNADQVRSINGERVISYGVSSYGYDVRCSPEFKVFTNINSCVVDPKNFDEKSFVTVKGDHCIVPPNSFALASTIEYMRIPRNVLTVCLGKSTYARCGIIVNVTPLEPEFEGQVVLEFSNTTNLPAKIYANEGVAQFLFFESDEECEVSYKDRGGKYMGQQGITLPRM